MHLQYKMFLLNPMLRKTLTQMQKNLQYKMFLLNHNKLYLNAVKSFHLQYKMFLLNLTPHVAKFS